MNITSITVCRKDSQRIKNKCLQKLNGKTLIETAIDNLLGSNSITNVVVGSNITKVKELCGSKNVNHFWREEYYCDESICSANEMIFDMCKKIDSDLIIWAHCTNPLITSITYDKAIDVFLSNEKEGYDSLLSVDEFKEHLWDAKSKPVNYNPYSPKHTLAKDLQPMYKQNGAIFIQRQSNFLKNKYFFGAKPYLFITPKLESIDINTDIDLKTAENINNYLTP